MLQDVLVGLVVLVAAAFVVRRVVLALRPSSPPPGCDACALHDSTDTRQTTH